jgi:hypothetical protein
VGDPSDFATLSSSEELTSLPRSDGVVAGERSKGRWAPMRHGHDNEHRADDDSPRGARHGGKDADRKRRDHRHVNKLLSPPG